MRTIPAFGLCWVVANLIVSPLALACGDEEVWLTQEEVAALKRGQLFPHEQMRSFYYVGIAKEMDSWAELLTSVASPQDEFELTSGRAELLATFEVPLQFAPIRLAPVDAGNVITDPIARQVQDQSLQRVILTCAGGVVIEPARS